MVYFRKLLLLAALTVALSQVAQANTIGTLTLSDCGNKSGCPEATYNFVIDVVAKTAALTITINGGVIAGVNDQIQSVNLGFTAQTLNGLTGETNMGGVWTYTQSALSNNGCSLSNNAPAACAMIASGTPTIITAGVDYSWTWRWTNELTEAQIFRVGDIHIGANYDPGKGLIVSQTIPEPNSLLLLSVALIGLSVVARRKPML